MESKAGFISWLTWICSAMMLGKKNSNIKIFKHTCELHPGKLTCPLKRDYFSREYIFQPLIFMGYVSFREGTIYLGIMAESINIILNKSKCGFIIDPGMVQTIPSWINGWSTNPPNLPPPRNNAL